MRRRLCETPYLTNMIQRSALILNNAKYRDRNGYVHTCVLHFVHRLSRLQNVRLDLRGYPFCMQYIKDEFRIDYVFHGRLYWRIVMTCWCSISGVAGCENAIAFNMHMDYAAYAHTALWWNPLVIPHHIGQRRRLLLHVWVDYSFCPWVSIKPGLVCCGVLGVYSSTKQCFDRIPVFLTCLWHPKH